MPDRTDYPLFTITDGLDITYSEFETRLAHGLLLEPRLVMPDTYFFSSGHLQEHVLRSDRNSISLFEAAMRRGLIVPVLRQPVKDFVGVLGYLRGQQLYGVYDPLDHFAFRLSESCDLENFEVPLPAHAGVSYDKLIRQCLLKKRPPGVAPEIWKLTEGLRHRGVVEARHMTKLRPGGDGLRRGELTRVAGNILGVVDLKDPHVVERSEILTRYAQLVGGQSSKYYAAKEFFDWAYEIHRINFAILLGASPSLFANSLNTLAVSQMAMPSIAKTGSGQSFQDQISVVIKIPSVRRLLRWPPEKLLDARDFGNDWRARARIFMADPSDLTRHQAEQALEEYAKKLRKISPVPSYSDLSVRALAMKVAPTLATAALGFALPEVGPYVATAASTGYLAYQYLIKGRYDKVHLSPGLNIIESSSATNHNGQRAA